MTFRVKLSGMTTFLKPGTKYPLLEDLALLLARVALGIILIAHGWQKFNEWTLSGTAASFEDMGVPVPGVSSIVAASAELIGGALLLIGLVTPFVALLNVVVQIGAFVIVHAGSGVFVDDGGFELVLAIAAGLLVIAVRGAGKFSVDALFPAQRRTTQTEQPVAQ